jgi:hypothetical protein
MRRNTLSFLAVAGLVGGISASAWGQEPANALASNGDGTIALVAADTALVARMQRTPRFAAPAIVIQNYKPIDKRGINVFETPKDEGVAYEGFKLSWGAAFTQQFQGLEHSNTADPRIVAPSTVDQNELMEIGNGFNNASANLYLNAQLARGIRVALTSYLSSRHHNDTWVKDGYLLVDASPFENALLDNLMRYVTLKLGHFEINYGDGHFRRTDNGNALQNPFVGNLIMDAFTTEVGGEVYLRGRGLMAMAALTGGEIRGNVTSPDDRGPAFIGKLGLDRQLTPTLRTRLTASTYIANKSVANTLYGGDRAGSRYFFVLENTQATESAQASSGLINPGFRYKVHAFVVNPFVRFGGLEFFGVAERASGRAKTETVERTWNQYAGEALYRFFRDEKLYIGGRYNTARGELLGIVGKPEVTRTQAGGGWFITPNVLMKGEYVVQKYDGFPTTDIRSGGKFNGFMIEGVVAF